VLQGHTQGIKRYVAEELASDSVYFSYADAAVEWAELALASQDMRDGLVERVKERGGPRSRS